MGSDDDPAGEGADVDAPDAVDPAADGEGWWDEVYAADGHPPWDVGRPQEAIRDRLEAGAFEGPVLDAGCGTGTHVLALAERGYAVTGIDGSARAIERAREKLAARDDDLDATLRVADALSLPDDTGPFGTVLDVGLCHAFEAPDRAVYADELAAVTRPGARAFVLAFGTDAPDDWGPNPLSPVDVEAAFDEGWRVREACEVPFETRREAVPGLLATIERV